MKELKDLKLKDFKGLEGMSKDELKTELNNSLKKKFGLTMKLQLRELKQTHLIKFLRRYVAKIRTVASKKDFNIG